MTEPREIYETVIQLPTTELKDELDRAVLAVLQRHVGKAHRIEREFLVQEVYHNPDCFADSSVEDRRVRESISRLRERYVILSSSGSGGYWLPESEDEAEAFIREMESRAVKMLAMTKRMRENLHKQFLPGVQPGLWEVG